MRETSTAPTNINTSTSSTTSDVGTEVWREWILDGIRKIRSQKQRPSIQRICQAIGSHHKFHEDIVAGKLEEAVASGALIKVYNKGLHTYKEPMANRMLSVAQETDLSKLVSKAVRELGECDGSSLKSIENYIQKSNEIELAPGTDLRLVIRNGVKKALTKELLLQDGKLYKVGQSVTRLNARKRNSKAQKNNSDGDSTLNVSNLFINGC